MFNKINDVPLNTKMYVSVSEDGRIYFSKKIQDMFSIFHNSLIGIKYISRQSTR